MNFHNIHLYCVTIILPYGLNVNFPHKCYCTHGIQDLFQIKLHSKTCYKITSYSSGQTFDNWELICIWSFSVSQFKAIFLKMTTFFIQVAADVSSILNIKLLSGFQMAYYTWAESLYLVIWENLPLSLRGKELNYSQGIIPHNLQNVCKGVYYVYMFTHPIRWM